MSEMTTIGKVISGSELGHMLEEHREKTARSQTPLQQEIENSGAQPPAAMQVDDQIREMKMTEIAPQKCGSREILQSYILTSALYDFDVYEKRILYNIIKFAQKELSGIKFKDSIRKIDHSLKDEVKVTLPMSDFLTSPDSRNHNRIKDALCSLQEDTFTYRDDNTWASLTLIAHPTVIKKNGISLVSFLVHERVWDVILNFSKGFNKFYFDVAFSLESVYSMRLYELIGSQTHSISFSIESLRNFFQLDKPKVARIRKFTDRNKPVQDSRPVRKTSRYPNTSDMIRKVIEPAKEELDRKSPVTFRFETIRAGKKITGITFTPVPQDRKLSSRAMLHRGVIKYGSSAIMTEQEIQILLDAGFDMNGIDNNLDVFVDAKRFLDDHILVFTELKGMCRSKDNPCGWFIEALRGKVSDSRQDRRKFL